MQTRLVYRLYKSKADGMRGDGMDLFLLPVRLQSFLFLKCLRANPVRRKNWHFQSVIIYFERRLIKPGAARINLAIPNEDASPLPFSYVLCICLQARSRWRILLFSSALFLVFSLFSIMSQYTRKLKKWSFAVFPLQRNSSSCFFPNVFWLLHSDKARMVLDSWTFLAVILVRFSGISGKTNEWNNALSLETLHFEIRDGKDGVW